MYRGIPKMKRPIQRGPAIKPYGWDEIKDIIERKRDLSLLCRSEEQEEFYRQTRSELSEKWKTVHDFILVSKFDHDKISVDKEQPNSKWQADPCLEKAREMRTSLSLNDHPYYFVDGIDHWVLWKIGGLVTPTEIDYAKNDLKKRGEKDGKGRKVIDTIHWINPPELKSLPEIDHAHILCLRK